MNDAEPVVTLNPGHYVTCRLDMSAVTEPGKISIALRGPSKRWELYSLSEGLETFCRFATQEESVGFELTYCEARGVKFEGVAA